MSKTKKPVIQETPFQTATRNLIAVCNVAGWECKEYPQKIDGVRNILRYLQKALDEGEEYAKRYNEENKTGCLPAGIERDTLVHASIGIDKNKYLQGLEGFFNLALDYFRLVKKGEICDLNCKRGEQANPKKIHDLTYKLIRTNPVYEKYASLFSEVNNTE